MEKMLINATQSEEVRVALIKNRKLQSLDIDSPAETRQKGDIHKAFITRIEPSLAAVFVNFGAKRHGFLPVSEIAQHYFLQPQHTADGTPRPINELLREGQELLVQVDKEERGNKGAALTTYITLAGYYVVFLPDNPLSGGISKRIEGDDRDELREIRAALTIPENAGLIIRTAGVGKDIKELQSDTDMLCNQWHAIQEAFKTQLAPCLIHQEGDVILRSIRDNLRTTVDEIIIDDHLVYVKVKHYIEQVKPEFLPCLKLYNNPVPLFSHYQVESQIEKAHQREIPLPSGGALVIDRTEALVAVDVNSAKATGGLDIESTARNTNIEAVQEIARQLRLRDLGGLVVIDLIDMNQSKNQRDVENALKDALAEDKARIQVGRISRFGLLEMSRQRLRPSLGEGSQEMCPRCEGRGSVRSIQSHCQSIVRLIEEEALKAKGNEIHVQLPIEMATYMMNEKRDYIEQIEKRHPARIFIIANPYFQSPKFTITSVKSDSDTHTKKPSFDLIDRPEILLVRAEKEAEKSQEPAVKHFSESHLKHPSKKTSWVQRIWRSLFDSDTPEKQESISENKPTRPSTTHQRPFRNRRRTSGSSGSNSSSGQSSHNRPQQGNTSGSGQRRRRSGHHHPSGQMKNTSSIQRNTPKNTDGQVPVKKASTENKE